MPEPIARDRDEFLQRIADRLPFDQAEKLDILRELAVHLSDSTARLEADGLTRDAAERTAIERLGPPERLADSLTEARRSPRRLLAAAGAGTWAAFGGLVYGYLFGTLILAGISIATVLLAAGPLHLFGGSWGSILDVTTMTVAALATGAYVGGRRLTSRLAVRGGYQPAAVRLAVALVGGAIVLVYVLFGGPGRLKSRSDRLSAWASHHPRCCRQQIRGQERHSPDRRASFARPHARSGRPRVRRSAAEPGSLGRSGEHAARTSIGDDKVVRGGPAALGRTPGVSRKLNGRGRSTREPNVMLRNER